MPKPKQEKQKQKKSFRRHSAATANFLSFGSCVKTAKAEGVNVAQVTSKVSRALRKVERKQTKKKLITFCFFK